MHSTAIFHTGQKGLWLLKTVQLNQIGIFDKIVNVENYFFKKGIKEVSFLHLQGKAA